MTNSDELVAHLRALVGEPARYQDVGPKEYALLHAARRIEALTAALAECYRLTGADADGNEDWRLAERAVEEVRRLRESETHAYHEGVVTALQVLNSHDGHTSPEYTELVKSHDYAQLLAAASRRGVVDLSGLSGWDLGR